MDGSIMGINVFWYLITPFPGMAFKPVTAITRGGIAPPPGQHERRSTGLYAKSGDILNKFFEKIY
jgi:hypothetical protein